MILPEKHSSGYQIRRAVDAGNFAPSGCNKFRRSAFEFAAFETEFKYHAFDFNVQR